MFATLYRLSLRKIFKPQAIQSLFKNFFEKGFVNPASKCVIKVISNFYIKSQLLEIQSKVRDLISNCGMYRHLKKLNKENLNLDELICFCVHYCFYSRMAYILHHSTTFHSHGSGYHKIDENGMSPVGHGHSHSLLGNHGNTSVRAAFIHVLGDLLQSFGVMVAAIIIFFRVNEH